MKNLRVYLLISLVQKDFDHSEEDVNEMFDIPANDRDAAIENLATFISFMSNVSVWGAMSLFAPEIDNMMIEIRVGCVSGTINYTMDFTLDKTVYDNTANLNLTPELEDWVDKKADKIYSDMINLLTDLAAAHFDGDADSGE